MKPEIVIPNVGTITLSDDIYGDLYNVNLHLMEALEANKAIRYSAKLDCLGCQDLAGILRAEFSHIERARMVLKAITEQKLLPGSSVKFTQEAEPLSI